MMEMWLYSVLERPATEKIVDSMHIIIINTDNMYIYCIIILYAAMFSGTATICDKSIGFISNTLTYSNSSYTIELLLKSFCYFSEHTLYTNIFHMAVKPMEKVKTPLGFSTRRPNISNAIEWRILYGTLFFRTSCHFNCFLYSLIIIQVKLCLDEFELSKLLW